MRHLVRVRDGPKIAVLQRIAAGPITANVPSAVACRDQRQELHGMDNPTPSGQDGSLTPAPLSDGVGVYERPRSAWLRQHLAVLIGLFLSLIGFAIFAIRRWA